MATCEVLLKENIRGLGAEGDVVKVKAGYARNFLLPNGICLPVTHANKKLVEALQAKRKEREAAELEKAQFVAKQLEAKRVSISVKVGQGDKLFGSVQAKDVIEKLADEGIVFEYQKLNLEAVKTVGDHKMTIKLHPEVSLEYAFEVVPEASEEAEAPAKEA